MIFSLYFLQELSRSVLSPSHFTDEVSETGIHREQGQRHDSSPGSLTPESMPVATRLVFAHLCMVCAATYFISSEFLSTMRQAWNDNYFYFEDEVQDNYKTYTGSHKKKSVTE